MKWFKKNEEIDYFETISKIEEESEPYIEEPDKAPQKIENIHDPSFFGKIQYLIDDSAFHPAQRHGARA